MIRYYQKYAIALGLISVVAATSLSAQNNDELVQSIVKLRSEVEGLYSKIEENRESYKSQMKSLSMQNTDNKAQLNRQTTALKLAQLEDSKVRSKIASTSQSNSDLMPLINSGSQMLRQSIQEGIPFKVAERLASVDDIHSQLQQGLITQEKALALVWAGFDDNLRLTKEIGLFKQQIEIDNKKILADIAKIGTVMMFFATADQRVGYAVKEGTGYRYHVATNKEEVEQINTLFNALKMQIRTGYFTLPNALVLMEGTK
jgi:hypothetical protein